MPELPEVEHTRQRLAHWATGRPLLRAEVASDFADGAELRALEGLVAGAPLRYGKRLAWPFAKGGLLLHLGMTGAWIAGAEPPRHARLGLHFEGISIWFADPRRLGWVRAHPQPAVALTEGLGPDALSGDLSLVFRGNTPIKVALMDQARLAGLGNIHATEALWRARLHPRLPAGGLGAEAREALVVAVRQQLQLALAERDPREELRYVSAGGPNPFAIYGRKGDPCPRCGGEIHREVLAGRGTWYCPACQQEKA